MTTDQRYWKLDKFGPTSWVLTLSNPPDNRLPPDVIVDLMKRLDEIEAAWRSAWDKAPDSKKPGGSVVFASESKKFWSNGLDPTKLTSPAFMQHVLYPLQSRVITFPLITIAAINGHCFAGGMLLALCCDYRLMTTGRGWMSMNELLIGEPIPSDVSNVLKARISPTYWTKVIMAHRWTAQEALAAGIVDETVDNDGPNAGNLLKRAKEMALEKAPLVHTGVWGAIKAGISVPVTDKPTRQRIIYRPEEERIMFKKKLATAKFRASKL